MTHPTRLLLPRGPMRLRHAPLELDLPERAQRTWSIPLPGCGPRLALASVDGHAVLVMRDGVAVLDRNMSPDPTSWWRVSLPVGRPGTAVAGSLPWVTDDGRLFRFTFDGGVQQQAGDVDAAIALDDDRVLIMPRGSPATVALFANGREAWRTSSTLADGCPGDDVIVMGKPGDPEHVVGLDLSSGRALWAGGPHPHSFVALVATTAELVWVACTDSTIAALWLRDGRLCCAHDTGARAPVGAVDESGWLQVCNETAWVSVRLTPERDIRTRRLSGVARMIDPPIPVRGGAVLVRTVRNEVLLLLDGGVRTIWSGAHPVWSVAAADERLYLLEGDDPPILHCLA